MIAKKDNKVFNISDVEVNYYSSQGFDIYKDDGSLYQYADTKVIKYNEHLRIVAEYEKRIAELENAEPAKEKPKK